MCGGMGSSMKQRLISSAIGLIILFAALALFDTMVPNVAIALIAAMGVWELLHATGCTKNKTLSTLSLAFALLVPFLSSSIISSHLVLICFAYVAALFLVLLRCHDTLHIQEIALALTFSLLVPFSLTTMLYMRDHLGTALGIFYALLVFGSAWLSDSCAYFAGRAFGKHKLAPVISPKKTVEGAVGGVLGAMVTVPLLLWGFALASAAFGAPLRINFVRLIALIPFFSVFSIVGDLSASIIKRQFGVKDYGSIMPGHGGIMDRFDSALMVAPLVFIVCRYFPVAALA